MADDKAVLIRDLIIFQIKLMLDGAKDLVLSPLSICAAGLDIIAPRERRGERFYRVMAWGEKFDRWLNLFGPAERAGADRDGLFGVSRAGSDSLLGRLEAMVLGHDEPETETEPRQAA